MRIAVVGKGWSGKTTICGLLAFYLQTISQPFLVIDADINMHLPSLLLGKAFPEEKYLSRSQNTTAIKTFLKGSNDRIQDLDSFRKTTPPAEWSNLFVLMDQEHPFYQRYAEEISWWHLMVVGTYEKEGIASSCYHNNLAIFENLLSHSLEGERIILADMVAGTDAFASSLHMQFDLLLFVVEPTKKSLEVWTQYAELAKTAGVYDSLFAVGNKCLDSEEEHFLRENIDADKLLGVLGFSKYLRHLEQEGGTISFSQLEPQYQSDFSSFLQKAKQLEKTPLERLHQLWKVHKTYVSQKFIVQRCGDLTGQIDPHFRFYF